jgi:hypothetical protein
MSVKEVVKEAAMAAPAGYNIGASLFGVPLQTWVMVLSVVLILCQLFWLFYNNLVRSKDGPTQSTDGTGAGK